MHVHRQNTRTSKTTNHNGAKVSDQRPTRRSRDRRLHNSDYADGRCGGASGVHAMSKIPVDRELVVRLCHTDNSIRQMARRELRNIYLGANEQPGGEVPEVVGHILIGGITGSEWEDNDLDFSTSMLEEIQLRCGTPDPQALPVMLVAQHDRIVDGLQARIAELEERVNSTAYRTSLIGKLEADNQRILDDLNMAWQEVKSEQRLSFRDQADQLRTELAALREQVPVRLTPEVREFLKKSVQDTYMGDSFSSTDSDFVACVEKLLLPIYAAPVAKQVVMPDSKKLPVQGDFAGRPAAYALEFADAKAHNACLDEVTRLNATDQGGNQRHHQQLVECDHCQTSGGCVNACMKASQGDQDD
jgi:hypothetical protein